jgi:glycosyltransferase involved in cell wall biosynthesis
MVSVIIPTLNEEKLLEGALSQFTDALKKKYHLEIIVSDGGSKDATLSIAERRADVVVRHSGDRKQTIAEGRNCGAAVARGDILFFTNADVRIPDIDNFFCVALKALEAENVIALTCKVYVFPEEEKRIDRLVLGWFNWHNYMLNKIMGMGRGECQMIKTKYFREVGGYNQLMAAGEDYNLFVRLKKKGKTLFLKNLTVYESPRRYRKYGYGKIVWSWFKNSVVMLVWNKSASQHWEEVR